MTRLVLLLGAMWIACAGQPPPVTPQQASDAAACNLAYKKAVAGSASCHEAQLRLDLDPACKPFTHINLDCR